MNNPKLITILLFAVCCFTNSVCSQPAVNAARRNNIFAFELYKKVYNSGHNVLLSPYSISSALSMVYIGAKNETEKQMSAVLHFEQDKINCSSGFFDINKELRRFE